MAGKRAGCAGWQKAETGRHVRKKTSAQSSMEEINASTSCVEIEADDVAIAELARGGLALSEVEGPQAARLLPRRDCPNPTDRHGGSRAAGADARVDAHSQHNMLALLGRPGTELSLHTRLRCEVLSVPNAAAAEGYAPPRSADA